MTSDEKDKRNKLISLTHYGKQYTKKLLGELYSFEETAFISMGDQQRANMLEGTETLIKNLLHVYEEDEKKER